MKLSERVELLLQEAAKLDDLKDKSLKDAERLADQFSDVKPQPFNLPANTLFGITPVSAYHKK